MVMGIDVKMVVMEMDMEVCVSWRASHADNGGPPLFQLLFLKMW